MRKFKASFFILTLAVTLLVICAASKQCIQIPLPVAVFVGLGIHVVALFWGHREKMHTILGPSRGPQEPGEPHLGHARA